MLDECNEEVDEDDFINFQYNQVKENESLSDSQLKLIENFDTCIKSIIDEYFINGDAHDVIQALSRFSLKQHEDGEILSYIIILALEKSNVYKELISRLLHDLNGIILHVNDYIKGFHILLTTQLILVQKNENFIYILRCLVFLF